MGTDRETHIEHFAPTEPDATLIELIHRDHDANVALVTIDSTTKKVRGANVPATELRRWIPTLRPRLESEGYFTLNGFVGGKPWPSPWNSELRDAGRQGQFVRWLTSCFVDLDLYNVGITVEAALERIRALELEESLLLASVVLRSGRGIWLIWLLADPQTGGPILSHESLHARYRAIQDALGTRLLAFGRDAKSKDLSRIARVPGSVNSKAGARVSYEVRYDAANARPIAYAFDELAELLGVPRRLGKAAGARPASSAHSAHGKRGHHLRAVYGLMRFARLRKLRAKTGFAVGTRHHAGFLLALFMLYSGHPRLTAQGAVRQFLREECARTNAAGELDEIVEDQHRKIIRTLRETKGVGIRVRSQTVADWLEITPAESQALLEFAGTTPWPAASWFQVPPPRPLSKRDKRIADRRKLVRKIVLRAPSVPSSRAIQAQRRANGFNASPPTVLKDLRLLGFKPNEPKRR